MAYSLREEWLNEGLLLLRKEIFLPTGNKLPPIIKVSCGFPATGAFSSKRRRIGECWYPQKQKGEHQLFISPTEDDPLTVLATLTHEGVHTIAGSKAGHRGPFKKVAWEVGLEGPMRATHAGDELEKSLKQFSRALGKYPHNALNKMTTGKEKQGTRLLKVVCPNVACDAREDDKHYCFRITQKWADIGLPVCPTCETELELDV